MGFHGDIMALLSDLADFPRNPQNLELIQGICFIFWSSLSNSKVSGSALERCPGFD
jgi:hypothetical protein